MDERSDVKTKRPRPEADNEIHWKPKDKQKKLQNCRQRNHTKALSPIAVRADYIQMKPEACEVNPNENPAAMQIDRQRLFLA